MSYLEVPFPLFPAVNKILLTLDGDGVCGVEAHHAEVRHMLVLQRLELPAQDGAVEALPLLHKLLPFRRRRMRRRSRAVVGGLGGVFVGFSGVNARRDAARKARERAGGENSVWDERSSMNQDPLCLSPHFSSSRFTFTIHLGVVTLTHEP